MENYVRLIVELPEDLKRDFKRTCAKELTDMSTRARQLIFDHTYQQEVGPTGRFFNGGKAGTINGESSKPHRERKAHDGGAGSSAQRRAE